MNIQTKQYTQASWFFESIYACERYVYTRYIRHFKSLPGDVRTNNKVSWLVLFIRVLPSSQGPLVARSMGGNNSLSTVLLLRALGRGPRTLRKCPRMQSTCRVGARGMTWYNTPPRATCRLWGDVLAMEMFTTQVSSLDLCMILRIVRASELIPPSPHSKAFDFSSPPHVYCFSSLPFTLIHSPALHVT